MIKIKAKFLLLFSIALLAATVVEAQPGCPEINGGPDVSLPCGTPCTTLTAMPFETGSTSSYAVSQIAYNPFPFNTGTPVLIGIDDQWSNVVYLPFTFCFFGNAYNALIIGSNSQVGFDTLNTGGSDTWSIPGPIPTNSVPDDLNCIMGPWQDTDPTNQGSTNYQILGTAPCRICVVSFYQTSLYGDPNSVNNSYCDIPYYETSQVVIYETTNVIEIYIAQKDTLCSDGGFGYWNNDAAIEGIQDNTGTNAYTVPGRNATMWTASDDAWRFTPNGPSIVSVSWYQGNTQISTDSVVTVCPSEPTTYVAQAVYNPCNGGAQVIVTDTVLVTFADSLAIGMDSTTNIICNGQQNGAAYAHVNGGIAPVTYGWSNGLNTLSITNLTAGTYIFTATDAIGCLRADTVIITQPAALLVNVPDVNVTSCVGTGSISANTNGGNSPYVYLWSSGQSTSSLTGINSGLYTITVTDSLLCTATGSGTLTVTIGGNTLVSGTPSQSNVSCAGLSDGSVIANITGGTLPYIYSWSNGGTSDTISNLIANIYTLTITDAGGCTLTLSDTVTEPLPLTLNPPFIIAIGCDGIDIGSITANVTGGTMPYSYSWVEASNGQTFTGQTIGNLGADNYSLTVTDANNCSTSVTYQVTQANALIFTYDSTNVLCFGDTSGTAIINITSGNPPYQYNWNGTGYTTNASITGLAAGINTVTIDDADCSVTASINITQPPAIVITQVSLTNVSCFSGSDGSVTANASGGTPNFTYQWSDGQTGPVASNLIADSITVVVIDAYSCTVSQAYVISQPPALIFNPPVIQNIGCAGGTTGSINLNVTGGTPNYGYSWIEQSNNLAFSGQSISNVAADFYSVTVTDGNNCTASATYQVSAIPLLTISAATTDVSCFGGSDGTANVTVLTGTSPYLYNWNGSGNTQFAQIVGFPAGQVTVIVTDSNSCTATISVNINQPPVLTVNLINQSNVLCFGASDGSVTVSGAGGTPGYSYQWNNGQIAATDSDLAATSVKVTVTDSKGCNATQSYQLQQPTLLTTDPVTTNDKCFGSADGSIDANPAGGTAPYTYLWSDNQNGKLATALVTGLYTCIVTDNNGCTVLAAGTVYQPAPLQLITSVTPVKCIGQSNGTISVSAVGGTPQYDFSATKDFINYVYDSSSIIMGLDTGTYMVFVDDTNSCVQEEQVIVPAPAPDVFTTSTDSTLCNGPEYADGSATINAVSIVNGPYQFSIDDGLFQFSNVFYDLTAGTHIITAMNINGCLDSIPVLVAQPPPIEVAITPDSIFIALGSGQQVMVTYTNASDVSYNWSPSFGLSCVDCPNPTVDPYVQGDYKVTVSMMNGGATCYGYATLQVQVGPHKPYFIPDAFSPNGDGNNDVFMIYGENVKTVFLRVFNRWGELVFQSNDQYVGWDGTYKGRLQMPEVYIYDATITFLDDQQVEKHGSVTLLR